jgi:hypothetical protein
MAKPVRPKQIWERALAGSRWLVQHQNQDGSWKGLSNPKVDAFYKSSWALTETGHAASAHRSLTYVRQKFFTPEGDFLPREHPWHIMAHYPYVNSYFIVGSMLTGHYQIAMPGSPFYLPSKTLITGDSIHGLQSKAENRWQTLHLPVWPALPVLRRGRLNQPGVLLTILLI